MAFSAIQPHFNFLRNLAVATTLSEYKDIIAAASEEEIKCLGEVLLNIKIFSHCFQGTFYTLIRLIGAELIRNPTNCSPMLTRFFGEIQAGLLDILSCVLIAEYIDVIYGNGEDSESN